ncbi:MAG TPA: phosphotransferase [Jatrophihabitans sp.]|jgi:Ser/Thr protein kinase RdoA (MazF antagonist)|nr:phosphotransferase [Jatrophihabitans sp.]
MSAEDGPLPGGTANRGRVIRVGNTVHRPSGGYTPAVHALLGHLADGGFGGAPRVLWAGRRTEVLGYIEGSAATEPLADWALTAQALASVGALLRDYHDHAASFHGTQLPWQRPVPERWRRSLVTHNDVNPANVIFRDGRAIALIDFDLAAPGTAAFDLAVTACFWAPLRAAEDVPDDRREQPFERFQLLLASYGADARLRDEVAEALPEANRWIADIIADAALLGHPTFGTLWERDAAMYERAASWLAANDTRLRAAAVQQDG